MASYLERYLNGEHEQVWNELIALGDAVRNEPVYSDAQAVARETMQRTRRNIEKLYERLQSIGYQFDCEKQRTFKNPLDGLRGSLADNPLMKSIFGDMLSNMGGVLQSFGFRDKDEAGNPIPVPIRRAYNPPEKDIVERLDEFEQMIGTIPLSVRAWCEIVGDVDFVGDYPGLASYERKDSGNFDMRGMVRGMIAQDPQMIEHFEETDESAFKDYLENSEIPFSSTAMMGMYRLVNEEIKAAKEEGVTSPQPEKETWWVSDPLAFAFEIDAEEAQWEMEEDEDNPEPGKYVMMVAPDDLHKANISGSSYDILLPDKGADTLLHGTAMHFVAYLRHSFAWGGFPGLANHENRNEQLIAMLKEGLEPI